MKCRFYESVFPEADEFVVVKTTRISEMGAYAELLEYDIVEGMMLYPEIGRRKTRSKHTLFKLGRMEVVRVIRVDKDKGMLLLWNVPPILSWPFTVSPTINLCVYIQTAGYIDLSRRYIESEDRLKCLERYNKVMIAVFIEYHLDNSN